MYGPEEKQAILSSTRDPIPSPKPKLDRFTISFYRRSGVGLYRTRGREGNVDPHMLYESLWMLAAIEEKDFDNFTHAEREFEKDLPLYLSAWVNSVWPVSPQARTF